MDKDTNMIIKATDADKEKLLEYLSNSVDECLYLYIDISNYSLETKHCNVWYVEAEHGLECVLMRYYDSYQLYSHITGYECGELEQIMIDNPCKMISARRDLIEKLSCKLTNYKTSYGVVFDMNRPIKCGDAFDVEWGTESDVEEIAALIQMDEDLGGHYSKETLIEQLIDRIMTKTGRSCILREDGAIIAHTATYAETNNIAIVSGTVVHPDYRNTDSFYKITTSIQSKLQQEGKKVYTFATSKKMIRYHKALHRICGEYGKMEALLQ